MNRALRTLRLHIVLSVILLAGTLPVTLAADFHPTGGEVADLVASVPGRGSIQFAYEGISTRVTRGWPQPVLAFHVGVANHTDDTLTLRSLDLWLVTDTGTVLSEPQLRQGGVGVERVEVGAGAESEFQVLFYLGPTGSFDGFTLHWGARLGSQVRSGAVVYEAEGDGYRPAEPPAGEPVPGEQVIAGDDEPVESETGDGDYVEDETGYEKGDVYNYYGYYGYYYPGHYYPYPYSYPYFTFGLYYGYYPSIYFSYSAGHHDGHHDGHHADHLDADHLDGRHHDGVRHDRDTIRQRAGVGDRRDARHDGRRTIARTSRSRDGSSGSGSVSARSSRPSQRSGMSRTPSARNRMSTPHRRSISSSRGRVSSRPSLRSTGSSARSRSSRSAVSRPSSRSFRSSGSRSMSRGGSRGGHSRSMSRGGSRGGHSHSMSRGGSRGGGGRSGGRGRR